MTGAILDMTEATGRADVGGKASALAELAQAGFDVPPFFVILPSTFDGQALKPEARDPLAAALAKLPGDRFAVRSSGGEEDGSANSHAGQFLSVLDVLRDGIAEAVERVAASGRTDSLRAYRVSRGLDPDGGAPAVIVQRLVDARTAGVMFTADPLTGRRDRVIINATAGLGDRLVAGEVDGESYVFDRASGQLLEGSAYQPSPEEKEWMGGLVAGSSTGPAPAPPKGALTATDRKALHDLATRVEAARGVPQDIEWAIEGDRLFLLQARPITTPLRPPAIPDDLPLIFDNSNIIESYPRLVSPLTYSFARYAYSRIYRVFVALVGVRPSVIRANAAVFDNMLARLDGRVYYNLGNWYRALALLPGFSLNAGWMETMMGVSEPLPPDFMARMGIRRGVLGRLADRVRMVGMAYRLARESIRLKRTMRAFYKRLNAALAGGDKIATLPLSGLAAEYRRIEAMLLDRWDAPLVNDFLCMVAFGASRKLIEKWAGPPGLLLHNDVMIGQGDIVSAEPAQRIKAMGRLAAGDSALLAALDAADRARIEAHPTLGPAVAEYLAKFGDRCLEELKLESITLSEDPRPLFASIVSAARSSRTEVERVDDADQRLATLFEGKRVRHFAMQRLMRWTKNRVRDRENLRFERTRVFGRARRVFLAIGKEFHASGVLDDPRDIFMLSLDEVLGSIEGFALDTDLRAIAARRRAEMEAFTALPDPPERIVTDGAAILRTRSLSSGGGWTIYPPESPSQQGLGCSAGIATGLARVITDPATTPIAPGEILVARHTDPGWIAHFSNAAAIVVERGSLLSHSAIVARELGIPCVVALKGAMTWLKTGDRVEVDGGTGVVRKLDG